MQDCSNLYIARETITGGTVTVGTQRSVAEQLIIGGRVKGTIHANRVKLNGSAIVEGDIFHRSLSIDDNAHFEGSSRREETIIDAPRIPLGRPKALAEIDTVVAIEGNGSTTARSSEQM